MEKPVRRRLMGWREWVSLPDLKIDRIKAKADTGARTSTLHADHIEIFVPPKKHPKQKWVRFVVHPVQRKHRPELTCELPLLEERLITDSGGHRTKRPVVQTKLLMGDMTFDIELTLTPRYDMGFRLLLGREAIKHYCIVDPALSFQLYLPKSVSKRRSQ